MEDLNLTDEELNKVNTIIVGIQNDLDIAISYLKNNEYDKAIAAINSGISKSNCPMCKRELGTLKADIVHNKEICILKSDTCTDEHTVIINKAYELKDDFVPIKTKKKAIRDKAKIIEGRKQLKLTPFPPISELLVSPHLSDILKNLHHLSTKRRKHE